MDYLEINRQAWNKRAAIHVLSKYYDVEGFLAGHNTLNRLERSEVGDVHGKKLLHLQCHFGLDTLSWARLGASVTGVDFSPAAINKANELKHLSQLEGQFICLDIDSFGQQARSVYDVVFTSYGTIRWLPDITPWANTIVNRLKNGGIFYIADFHPIYNIFAGSPYFASSMPTIEKQGTYTENCDGTASTIVTWAHPLGEVVNALIQAGIHIDFIHEYPYSPYNCFPGMEEREKGRFYLTHQGHDIPLVYSIRGIRK